MRIKTIPALLFIILLAGFLRIWQLNKIPVSLNWDEAAIGYNAYCILKTGKDEYGMRLPLFIRAFGEYKSAITSYLSIPFIKLFGLNEWAVRLPTAFFGILGVIATYFLVKKFFSNFTSEVQDKDTSEVLGLITTFLLAISPWHIHFSRFANEGLIASTFMLFGLVFWFSKKKNFFSALLSSLFFSLSFYSYHSVRMFLPLFILVLILIDRKLYFLKQKTFLRQFLVCLIIFLIPFLVSFKTSNPLGRSMEASIFHHKEYIDEIMEGYYKYEVLHLPGKRIFNNKIVLFGAVFLKNYLEHFSLEFLFLGKEVSPRLGMDNFGKLYLIELPFLLYGFITMMLAKDKKLFLILFCWLLLAPLASALSLDTPHSLRVLVLLPVFQIFISFGFFQCLSFLKTKSNYSAAEIFSFITFILFLFNFGHYLHFYYLYYPEGSAYFWQDGLKEVVNFITPRQKNYSQIIVTVHAGQPHIFFAFWGKKDPLDYQKQRIAQKDFRSISYNLPQLDNIIFKEVANDDFYRKNTLIVTPAEQFENLVKPTKIILLHNRYGFLKPVFNVFESERLATGSAENRHTFSTEKILPSF